MTIRIAFTCSMRWWPLHSLVALLAACAGDTVDPAVLDPDGDADDDGVSAELDCDDSDPAKGARKSDADCDGTTTKRDCDDSDPASHVEADDGDCDGVLTAEDCDDGNAFRLDRGSDADCDGVVNTDDKCDGNDVVGDEDLDGVCDDLDDCLGNDSSGNADRDAFCTDTDCDDASANNCSEACPVVDIDGNSYATVWLAERCWTQSNLKTIQYNNGISIRHETDANSWDQLGPRGAWADHNNYEWAGDRYGKLYNFEVLLHGPLCPIGWHVADFNDWGAVGLSLPYGSVDDLGGALKETGTDYWLAPNEGATNSTGLSLRGGGARRSDGTFTELREDGNFWIGGQISYVKVRFDVDYVDCTSAHRNMGLSVRCVRD